MRSASLVTSGLAVAIATILAPAAKAAPAKPNVILILADDIGYGDLGCQGATRVKTPNLDRLAREGMRFTDAHSPAAVCTPTRYSLMTGQYPWRHRPGASILSGVAPLCIPPDRFTLAHLFKKAGHATAVVGKWHLGLGNGPTEYNGPIVPGPREVGFDESFIIPATGDRVPTVYVENGRVAGYDPADPIRVSYETLVGNEPLGRDHPELLKMKHSHGHDFTIVNGVGRIGYMSGGKAARWVDEDMSDVLAARATRFIEANRARPFFLYLATHDIHVPRLPHPRFKGTSGCGIRGDAIHELDAAVGTVLETLDRLKLTNDTLVIFTSDNGGVLDDGYADGALADLNGHKANGPLRGFKGGLYEGGSRVPFLARWPGRIPAGTTSRQLMGHNDLLATCASILGEQLPQGAGPDSIDQLPSLLAETPEKPRRDTLVTQAGYVGGLAIRRGPWKLIPSARPGASAKKAATKKAAAGPELYNLEDDLAETTNLAARHPEKVRELEALLARIRGD